MTGGSMHYTCTVKIVWGVVSQCVEGPHRWQAGAELGAPAHHQPISVRPPPGPTSRNTPHPPPPHTIQYSSTLRPGFLLVS